MKLPIQFLTLTIAMAALAISQAKMGGVLDSRRHLQSGQCEICSKENKNRPDYLTLEYVPQGVNSIFQDSSKATCVGASYPTQTTIVVTNKDGDKQVFGVQANSVFTINGPFDAETDFYFDNNRDCFIHTSCSVPLVAGDQIGPFKVLAGTGCDNGGGPPQTENPPSATPCEICSKANKNKPDFLSLEYNSDGKNSVYQDSSKATCTQGPYPASTTLVTTNKDDNTQVIPVEDGTVFEISGEFETETVFNFADGGSCFIHTSCSVPLVAGDQIGPFKVLAGTGCTSGVGQTQPAPGTCEICSSDNRNKPDYLSLEYNPDGKNSVYQDSSKATCTQGDYPESTTLVTTNKDDNTQVIPVEDGTVFVITGEFESETVFNFAGGGSCFIHTSCSVPLVAGDQIGPFKVLAGTGCTSGVDPNGPIDQIQPGRPCEICSSDNMNKPEILTLLYKPAGKNSVHQDSSKATCREAMYPTDTSIATTNSDGNVEIFKVEDGTVFVITGTFKDATVFNFVDGSFCSIQTSCSARLVAGDQIGPFVVLEGNDCKYSTSSPSAQPSASPSAQPTGTPSTPPTPAPSKSIPSAQPTGTPSTPPTSAPSPSPSAEPTSTPSTPPTPAPSPSPSAKPSPSPSAQPTGTPSTPPTSAPSPSPSAEPTSTPSTPPTPAPSPSPSNFPSATPSMTPTKAACVKVDEPSYNEGANIVVSYNTNFNEADPLLDGLICIFPCSDIVCEVMPLKCGNPAPANCVVSDSTGEHVFTANQSMNNDGTMNSCFKVIVFRNEGPTPVPQCCSDDFSVGFDSICED